MTFAIDGLRLLEDGTLRRKYIFGEPTLVRQDRSLDGFSAKALGAVQFRAGNTYCDIKTNCSGDNVMFQFIAQGYLYNYGNLFSLTGGYTYQSTIINQATHDYGSAGSGILRTYRATDGALCLKLKKSGNGYTEGFVHILFHAYNQETQDYTGILSYQQNDSPNNYY